MEFRFMDILSDLPGKWQKVDTRDRFLLIFSSLVTVLTLGVTLFFPFDVEEYVEYGYLGVAGINFLSSIAPFSPIPAFMVTLVAALTQNYNSLLLIIISSVVTSLGQSVMFLLGDGLDKVVRDYGWHAKLRRLFFKAPFLFLVVWIGLPNPVQAIGQIFAGTAEYPYWKYYSASLIGNTIWFSILVFGADWVINFWPGI